MLIPDLHAGLQILSRLPLANPQQAQRELDRFLDSLLQTPPQIIIYLDLLEHSRMPLCFVEEELARNYINKPLPLSKIEERNFSQVIGTWQKVAQAYAQCAQLDVSAHTPDRSLRTALILHRCIYYIGMVIVEHHRARREIPQGLWLEIHAYFATAEKQGVDTISVPDVLDSQERSTHCTAAFLGLLLSELAGPYSLSIRDQSLVRRWANNWSSLVSLRPVSAGESLPQFVIDLTNDVALRPTAEHMQTDQLRRLDSSRLAIQLRNIRHQLRNKVAPTKLGLGEDCSTSQCRRLLKHISNPWSQIRIPRKFRRYTTSGVATLCTGFDAMHYYISGKEFALPKKDHTHPRQGFEAGMLETEQALKGGKEQLAFATDRWDVVNQSANGFRLICSSIGSKMIHGQLLAICPHAGERFLLGITTWLMQENEGKLIAGVEALAGSPQAIVARPLAHSVTHNEPYSRAFLLPAVPAIGSEQSLIIPQGWYRAFRVIEILTETAWCVELLHVLEDGPEFERVSFTVVK